MSRHKAEIFSIATSPIVLSVRCRCQCFLGRSIQHRSWSEALACTPQSYQDPPVTFILPELFHGNISLRIDAASWADSCTSRRNHETAGQGWYELIAVA